MTQALQRSFLSVMSRLLNTPGHQLQDIKRISTPNGVAIYCGMVPTYLINCQLCHLLGPAPEFTKTCELPSQDLGPQGVVACVDAIYMLLEDHRNASSLFILLQLQPHQGNTNFPRVE